MFTSHLLSRFHHPQASSQQQHDPQGQAVHDRTPMPHPHGLPTDLAILNGSKSASEDPVISDVFFGHPVAECGELIGLTASPEHLTPQKHDPDAEDNFETPRANSTSSDSTSAMSRSSSSTASAASTAPSSVSDGDELIDVAPEVELKPRYSQYLEALSDEDLLHRKQLHKHHANQLKRRLAAWNGRPEAVADPNYIETLRKARKHQAEHELTNGELMFRDIAEGRIEPFTPEGQEAFDQYLGNCAAEVDACWQRQDGDTEKTPQLTKTALRFLTEPHPSLYFSTLQQQTDGQLTHRKNVYKLVLQDAEDKLKNAVWYGSGPTDYAYQLNIEPRGMNIFSLAAHKRQEAQLNDDVHHDAESQWPIVGRSLFADEEWQKVKNIGKYRAEQYLAGAELYRRNVNRGNYEIPSPEYLKGILDNLDEYIEDAVTEFKPQPLE